MLRTWGLRSDRGGMACSGLRSRKPDLCVLHPRAATHPRYNPSESSTYYTEGQTFSLQYGTGSLTGFFGYDTMTVSEVPCSWLWGGRGVLRQSPQNTMEKLLLGWDLFHSQC